MNVNKNTISTFSIILTVCWILLFIYCFIFVSDCESVGAKVVLLYIGLALCIVFAFVSYKNFCISLGKVTGDTLAISFGLLAILLLLYIVALYLGKSENAKNVLISVLLLSILGNIFPFAISNCVCSILLCNLKKK